nr:GNAT family N-acetyltransferase [Clostridium sporogenes]
MKGEIIVEIIQITGNNIDKEHICCVITEKKGENCIKSKKEWLKERFKDGLIFKKLNIRGKVFIEYIPGEKAWYPINANEYMVMDCFWVSGRYKGQGISNILLNECINDSKYQGKKGIVALSSKKKNPFLSDGNYLKYKGFKVADTAKPYYELLYLPFEENAEKPSFKECAKESKILKDGLVVYYSNQCPYTEKYIQIIKKVADERGIELTINKYENLDSAKNAPSPFTTYSLFFNGEFITNEILSENKFIKFLDEKGL